MHQVISARCERPAHVAPGDLGIAFNADLRVQAEADTALNQCNLAGAIAKGIVEAHGGQIALETEPHGGNVFVFTIPVAHPGVME